MLVVMAVTTTLMTGPLLNLLLPRMRAEVSGLEAARLAGISAR